MMKTRFNPVFHFLFVFLGLLCLNATTSCRDKNEDSRPVVAVSLEPYRNILENIAGDRFRIVTVMPTGDNPETFEPSPSSRIAVEDSKLYFLSGLLPFEKKIRNSVGAESRFIDTSDGIELLYDTHVHVHGEGANRHAHRHSSADPHVWTSVKNVRLIARNITEALANADPANAEEYRRKFKQYTAHLDSLENNINNTLKDADIKAFMVWHPSLSYFARDFGLKQISVSPETKELSVGTLAKIIDKAREEGVGVMFYQREYDSRQAEVIKESVQTKIKTIGLTSYDWEDELTQIANEIASK